MDGRYYSVQFTDRPDGTNFAYVGSRTTGTQAGDYLVIGPNWQGAVPSGMTQISSPNNSVLLIGRVLVASDSDLSTAIVSGSSLLVLAEIRRETFGASDDSQHSASLRLARFQRGCIPEYLKQNG